MKYPEHMIRCPNVELREKLRVLIKRLAGILDKTAYEVVMAALEKYDKEL